MDLSKEYRKMCFEAKEIQEIWNPEDGDFMVSVTSYCYTDNNECTKKNPCSKCLGSSNVYTISGGFKYDESIGGEHWYFCGGACVQGEGLLCNGTFCFIMTNSGKSTLDEGGLYTSKKSKMLWLPRQDQLQNMFWNGYSNRGKLEAFSDWLHTEAEFSILDSYEKLWLMCYMEKKHNKKWNAISNIKRWENINK